MALDGSGPWKVFVDFVPAGAESAVILAADVTVPGAYAPTPLTPAAPTTQVDGYTVTLDGDLTPGAESDLTARITRDGRDVTDLQPYLAAYGHLVALRSSDLAYLHVHPLEQAAPGPEIAFGAEVPSTGTYRLFLQFRHGDAVHTAAFTRTA